MRAGIRDAAAVVLGVVAVLGMTGCVPEGGVPSLPPSPTSTPVFASEEEALAAAEDAYAAYSAMSDLITADGGQNPERLAPFVTEDQLAREIEGAEYFSSQGWRSQGSRQIGKALLQQYTDDGGSAEIVVYVCVDISEVRIVDGGGVDVTPPDRPNLIALEVGMISGDESKLLIESSDQWSDTSFCF